jgi:predicted Zn-dependent peptidase
LPKKFENNYSYKKTVLDNGVRIITEEVPYLQSVSLGIWIRSGSRFEAPDVNGICHFIEHMLFKGTDRRSAFTIAKEIDNVGGVLNAFTSKEMTSFYCRVLSENVELAADLLSDIFLNSSFPEDEIEREKQVVVQEICQMEDNPEDLVHEILGMRFWQNDPLGQPILGTIPTIEKFDRATVMEFKRDHYGPTETLVCAAGKLNHQQIVDLFSEQMGGLSTGKINPIPGNAQCLASAHIEPRELEQVHVCIGMQCPSAVDEKRHAAYILNSILGGGMSSRLFQEVREKRGLAYSVYSFLSAFSNTGIFGIYAGCEPDRLEELLSVVGKESLGLSESLTEEEIQTAKSQIRGNLILALESSEARMNRLAKGEYYFGRYMSLEEIIESLEKVTTAEAKKAALEIIDPGRLAAVTLGPIDENADLFGLLTG